MKTALEQEILSFADERRDRLITLLQDLVRIPSELSLVHAQPAGVPLGTPGATNLLRVAFVGRSAGAVT